MPFHVKLRELRKKKNLSQETLSEIIGVTRQSVAKWESGETFPEIDKLLLVSDYFRVSLDSLVKDDEPCAPVTAPTTKTKTETLSHARLIAFLCKAKKATYAGHGTETVSSRLGSHDLIHSENEFVYLDSYFGSERFTGEECVWEKNIPVWAMNYSGRVIGDGFSGDFLKEVLSLVEQIYPYRGPPIHANGEYTYHCLVNGTFDWFTGHEEIFAGKVKVYECRFHGGIII